MQPAPPLTPENLLELVRLVLAWCFDAGSSPPSSLCSILETGILDIVLQKLETDPKAVTRGEIIAFLSPVFENDKSVNQFLYRARAAFDSLFSSTIRFSTRILNRAWAITWYLIARLNVSAMT